jgi:multidrug efflux pump subunit AcrA (membrane-fusion protein)
MLLESFNLRCSKSMAGAIVAFLAMMLAAGCAERTQAGAENAPAALPVKMQVVQAQRVGEYSEYLATLKSRNASLLQPQVEGYVTRILVHSGDHVEAGQPILEIDPRKQEAAVNNQESTRQLKLANLEWARRELERRKQLFASGVISRQELDQQETAFAAANADVDAM